MAINVIIASDEEVEYIINNFKREPRQVRSIRRSVKSTRISKVCSHCGNEFYCSSNKTKYCSRKCFGLDKRKDNPELRKLLKRKWSRAKSRCRNKKDPSYPNYGGRGIEMRFKRREWVDYILNTIGPPTPEKNYIDRIDNDGHYEPGNLRWVSIAESNKNRRSSGWKWGPNANRRGRNK